MFFYPPILLLFAIQVGLNLLSFSWPQARWLKPAYIWLLSFIGIYLINRSLFPEPSTNGEYRCGTFMIVVIILTIYGVVVNSIIYYVFSKLNRSLK